MFFAEVSNTNRSEDSVSEICSPPGVTKTTVASILPASNAKSAALSKSS